MLTLTLRKLANIEGLSDSMDYDGEWVWEVCYAPTKRSAKCTYFPAEQEREARDYMRSLRDTYLRGTPFYSMVEGV